MPVNPCCCAPASPPCGGCIGGTAPATIQVVISGATSCGSCFALRLTGLTNGWGKVVSGDINGTHCLAYDTTYSVTGGTCVWSCNLASPITLEHYSDSGCTVLVKTEQITKLFVRSTPIGTNRYWIMASSFDFPFTVASSGPNSPYPESYAFIFYDTHADCVGGTFANALGGCGFTGTGNTGWGSIYPAYNVIFTGGSAVVTNNGC